MGCKNESNQLTKITFCPGFVIARPLIDNSSGTQTSFYHVMGSNKKKVKVYTRQANEAPERMEFLRNKRFVVKVQVPIPVPSQNNMPRFGSDQMMVYNADRTVDGFIYSTEKGMLCFSCSFASYTKF